MCDHGVNGSVTSTRLHSAYQEMVRLRPQHYPGIAGAQPSPSSLGTPRLELSCAMLDVGIDEQRREKFGSERNE